MRTPFLFAWKMNGGGFDQRQECLGLWQLNDLLSNDMLEPDLMSLLANNVSIEYFLSVFQLTLKITY